MVTPGLFNHYFLSFCLRCDSAGSRPVNATNSRGQGRSRSGSAGTKTRNANFRFSNYNRGGGGSQQNVAGSGPSSGTTRPQNKNQVKEPYRVQSTSQHHHQRASVDKENSVPSNSKKTTSDNIQGGQS